MIYYIGTKEELEQYNYLVSTSEGYNGVTQSWAKILKHPSREEYLILGHPHYKSDLPSIDRLPEDWYDM